MSRAGTGRPRKGARSADIPRATSAGKKGREKRNPSPPTSGPSDLRNLAEERVGADEIRAEALSPEDTQRALHELRVHQLELEMQNEELRRAQLELETARARYFDLYDLAPVGYFTLSERGLFLEANLTIANLLGVPRRTLQEIPLARFIFPEDQDTLSQHRRMLYETLAPQSCELRLLRQDGSHFWARVEATVAQDDAQEAPVYRAVVSDLTAQKRAEEERIEMDRHMRALHSQRLESLGVLAGGIAHDFNNLLMGVLGHADLALLDLPATSPLREHLSHIKTTAVRLGEIAKQMLAYSGKGRFIIEPLSLCALVGDMTDLLRVSLPKKVILKLDLSPDLAAIEADCSQIRQVVMNLITNAAEAIGEGGGLVTVRTGVVAADGGYFARFQCGQELPAGDYAYLEVSDTGCGMTREVQEKMFDPFFTMKGTGRGLGLAAAQGIVTGHKGAIQVHSEPGKGTTFKILLPCSKPSDVAGVRYNPAPEPGPVQGAGELLLVIDDEETVRTMARLMLERAGYAVLAADGGEEALALLREHAKKIRGVLLDLSMPKIDGLETFTEIHRLAPDLPVILCSGYDEQDATSHFIGQGLADFVQKPYDFQTLTSKVSAVMARTLAAAGGRGDRVT